MVAPPASQREARGHETRSQYHGEPTRERECRECSAPVSQVKPHANHHDGSTDRQYKDPSGQANYPLGTCPG